MQKKSATQSTEAVSFLAAVVMECLQFWHMLDEYNFQTFVVDMLKLCQMVISASLSFFWTGDVGGCLWGLWLMRLRVSHRRLAISSAPCFAGEAAASEDTKTFLCDRKIWEQDLQCKAV